MSSTSLGIRRYQAIMRYQGWGFDPRSGHIQLTNERISKWNNKSMFLSLSCSQKSIIIIIIIIIIKAIMSYH